MEGGYLSSFFLFLFANIICLHLANASYQNRTFTIDYEHDTFLKDGRPFRYVSGSIHYARVPHGYWEDRLQKIYAAGLNAIQVYIPWNWHEPEPGQYLWSGDHDLVGFLKIAQEVGLVVILRAGPYICGEWDYGGFPGWILKKNGSIVVRTMDPGYITPVDNWLNVLLPKIKPMLYINGGPVIMVQIENEYGSYFACDTNYMEHLKQIFSNHLGPDALLFTTDGAGVHFLKCGAHKGVYATVDFGPGNATAAFLSQRVYEPKGPLVNSEYYTGWLDYWGGGHAHGDTANIIKTLTDMMNKGASVNMYMFHGGTNFGYTNGADPVFSICPTSYDYDAPITEAGDTTSKYDSIRNLLLNQKYKLHDEVAVPQNTSKRAYGTIKLSRLAGVLDLLGRIAPDKPFTSQYPRSMEELNQNSGFMLYRTKLTSNYSGNLLNVSCIRDRGYVMLDGEVQGIVDRNGVMLMNLVGRTGQILDILVENQGHINFGTQINGNRKGLVGNVLLSGKIIQNWSMYPLNFTQLFGTDVLENRQNLLVENINPRTPSVYIATMPISANQPADTYLNPTNWFKGQAFINGFNLGRYWPVRGPQVTLYVPKSVWNVQSTNQIIMMVELENAPCATGQNACNIVFQDYPILNSKTGG